MANVLGIEEPRRSVDDSSLPNARLVSSQMHRVVDSPSHLHTHLLMTFGQFLDHDLSRTAVSQLAVDPSGYKFLSK